MTRKSVALVARLGLLVVLLSTVMVPNAQSGLWDDFWCWVDLQIAIDTCVDAAPHIDFRRCVKEATCDYKRCIGKKDPTCDGVPAAPAQQRDWGDMVDHVLLTEEIVQRLADIDLMTKNQPMPMKHALVEAGMSKETAQEFVDQIVAGIRREKPGTEGERLVELITQAPSLPAVRRLTVTWSSIKADQ